MSVPAVLATLVVVLLFAAVGRRRDLRIVTATLLAATAAFLTLAAVDTGRIPL